MKNEVWKEINDIPNYEVSNLGNIRSKKTLRKLKCGLVRGYPHIDLYNSKGRKNYYIHRLVAELFIPNPNNLPQVNHKDGNKLNNSVDNLEWCTCKENILHGIKNGLKIYKKGTQSAMYGKYGKNSNRAIPILQFDLNNNLIKQWDSQIEIQRELGYKQSVISNCCNGRGKTAYGYIWKHKAKENK